MPADATPHSESTHSESTQPPLIDLGTDFDAEPPPRRRWLKQSGPRPKLWKRMANQRVHRGWWAVPIVAILLFVTASVLPPKSPLSLVAKVSISTDASALIGNGRAVIIDADNGIDRIREYDLHGGGLTWSTPLKVLADGAAAQIVNESVVVSSDEPSPSGVATQVFDLASGRSLWHSADSVVTIDRNDDLVTDFEHSDGTSTLQLVATRTGRIAWSLDVPAGCTTVSGSSSSKQMLELCLQATPGGLPTDTPTLHAVDLMDGSVTATRHLHYNASAADILVPPDQRMRAPEVTIIGDLVLLLHNGFPPAVDAFNVATLETAWTGTPAIVGDTLSRCGDLICMTNGAAVSVVDPASGKVIPGAKPPAAELASRLVIVPVSASLVTALPRVGASTRSNEDQGFARATSGIETDPIPQVMAGVNVKVPTPVQGSAWIDVQRIVASTGSSTLTQLRPLAGIGAKSCFTSGGYLVCATAEAGVELLVWRATES